MNQARTAEFTYRYIGAYNVYYVKLPMQYTPNRKGISIVNLPTPLNIG